MLRGFAEDLKQEFRGYNSAALMKDLMAGLTVTACRWRWHSVSAPVPMPHPV